MIGPQTVSAGQYICRLGEKYIVKKVAAKTALGGQQKFYMQQKPSYDNFLYLPNIATELKYNIIQ